MANNDESIFPSSPIYDELLVHIENMKSCLLNKFDDINVFEFSSLLKQIMNFLDNNTTFDNFGEIIDNSVNDWVYAFNVYDKNYSKILTFAKRYDITTPTERKGINDITIYNVREFSYITFDASDAIKYVPSRNVDNEPIYKYFDNLTSLI
jgi:hypothetical protein